jgi:uncharacterized protein (DUF983 family)
MAQPTALSAALQCKCPQCRKGPLFKKPAYSLGFVQMYDTCSHCGLKFEVETGFFWGAMYFTYAFSVAIFLTVYVALTVLLPDPPLWKYIAAVLGVNVVLFPLMVRYSRVAMLYLFGGIRYNPSL